VGPVDACCAEAKPGTSPSSREASPRGEAEVGKGGQLISLTGEVIAPQEVMIHYYKVDVGTWWKLWWYVAAMDRQITLIHIIISLPNSQFERLVVDGV